MFTVIWRTELMQKWGKRVFCLVDLFYLKSNENLAPFNLVTILLLTS